MTTQPLISIIIPCYNTAQFVAEALDSALAQTYTECEIIAVDDGSTDNSPAILDQYAAQYPDRIRVIHQANQGLAQTRMNAIAHARGEFIVPLDADDRLHPEAITTWLAYQQAHPDYAVIYGPCYMIDVQGQRTDLRDYSLVRVGEALEGPILPTLLVSNVVMACAFIQKEALLAVGGYVSDDLIHYAAETVPEQHGFNGRIEAEDYFCYLRLALAGYQFGYEPRPLFDYRATPGSLSKDRQRFYDSQRTFLKFLTRHYPEQIAEAWFKGLYVREMHTGQSWLNGQAESQKREQQLAETEHQLQETIAHAQSREILLADYERQLRETIAHAQSREILLADYERQLRETIAQAQSREETLADFERRLHEAIAQIEARDQHTAELEQTLHATTTESQARAAFLSDAEQQLQQAIADIAARDQQIAELQDQLAFAHARLGIFRPRNPRSANPKP